MIIFCKCIYFDILCFCIKTLFRIYLFLLICSHSIFLSKFEFRNLNTIVSFLVYFGLICLFPDFYLNNTSLFGFSLDFRCIFICLIYGNLFCRCINIHTSMKYTGNRDHHCKQLYCNSSFSHCYPPNFRHEKRHSVYTECPYTKSSYILIYARTHYIYYNINYNICISFYYNTKINPSVLPYRGVPWDILTWTPLLSLCKYYIINHVI